MPPVVLIKITAVPIPAEYLREGERLMLRLKIQESRLMGYAWVRCSEVHPEGMRSDWMSACIVDIQDDHYWIQLPKNNMKEHDGQWYMAVGTVYSTPDGKLFLIEFNFEADNGSHRCWIRATTVLEMDGVGFTVAYPRELEKFKYDDQLEYHI